MRILFFVAILSPAQPTINNGGTGIVNAASYAVQGLPNSPIAQGSIFSIFGSGLGPMQGVQASAYPLATSLDGVSISISQGTVNVAAIPLYVSASQINAIMPSDAPLGSDNIIVTVNGRNSIPCVGCQVQTVEVVPASFGIFAVNAAGSGQGVVTNGKNEAILYTHSAMAGEILNIWGTGLGAIQGSDTVRPFVGDVGTMVPIVYVGGVEVHAGYHGRSGCCSGLDQIQFQVPPNVIGCNVPVAVQIGNIVSNFVSIAIASSDSSCSDVNGMTPPDLAELAARGSIRTGYAEISRAVSTQYRTQEYDLAHATCCGTATTDYGYANFEEYNYANFSLTELPLQLLNSGACSVYSAYVSNGPPFQVATPTVNALLGIALDAGTTITINGPNGQKQIAPVPPPFAASVGNYGDWLGSSDPNVPPPLYLTEGSYTISDGNGGKDVGPFSAVVEMPPEGLTWTNQSSLTTITRANGVTLTWTGADPSGYVIISGLGGVAGFNCTADPAAGHFTVPPIVLLAIGPSGVNESDGVLIPEGSLGIGVATKPVRLNAAGLDLFQATSSFTIEQNVTYK